MNSSPTRRKIATVPIAILILSALATSATYGKDKAITWAAKPSEADYRAYAPPNALKAQIDGAAIISCAVTRSGQLQNCAVDEEAPRGMGFGLAAIHLSGLFRVTASDASKMSEESVQLNIRFRLNGQATAAATSTAPAADKIAAVGEQATTRAPTPAPILVSEAPVMPVQLARFSPPSGRMAMIGLIPGWQAYLLDLDSISRQGETIDIVRLTVFAQPRSIGDRQEIYQVSGTRLACGAGIHQDLGARTYDSANAPVGWTAPASAAERDEPGSFEQSLAGQLCAGAAPVHADAVGASQAVATALNRLGVR